MTERMASLWARQLHEEFEQICWQYSIELLPPVFEISNTKRQLGAWLPMSRTIRISSQLIRNYSWAVTLHVLKHEIAHQLCTEILGSSEVAHGKDFQEACEYLGVLGAYRGASGDLLEDVEAAVNGTPRTSAARRFIEKVEKLLALAQSSNEHEAALAMQKANELIQKHTIASLDAPHDIDYDFVIINRKKKRIESWQRQICAILRDFFYVRIVNSYLYDPFTDQTHKTIELLGSTENVAIAEYCYYFLENKIAALWSRNRHKFSGSVRTEKNSYYAGLLNGFYVKLSLQAGKTRKEKSTGASLSGMPHALVVTEDVGLNRFVGRRFPRLYKLSRRGARLYESTYNDGLETGQTITLHKGVTQEQGNQGRLLS